MQVLNFVSHAYFYFIWFFAQFPDLFIWLYPFSLIQSNPLKVWFDCFRLFLGQIYKSFNWFYKFLVLYLPNLQICPFWFPSTPSCQSWFWCFGYLGQTCLFGLKPSRSQNLCFTVQTLISRSRPSKTYFGEVYQFSLFVLSPSRLVIILIFVLFLSYFRCLNLLSGSSFLCLQCFLILFL